MIRRFAKATTATFQSTGQSVERIQWSVLVLSAFLLARLGAWARRSVWATTGREPSHAASIASSDSVATTLAGSPPVVRTSRDAGSAAVCKGLGLLVEHFALSPDANHRRVASRSVGLLSSFDGCHGSLASRGASFFMSPCCPRGNS
jgi:hypothetical protein